MARFSAFIVAAGPLDGSETGRIRVLLIADAGDAADLAARLATDPWERSGQIATTRIEPWTLLTGALRVPLPGDAP